MYRYHTYNIYYTQWEKIGKSSSMNPHLHHRWLRQQLSIQTILRRSDNVTTYTTNKNIDVSNDPYNQRCKIFWLSLWASLDWVDGFPSEEEDDSAAGGGGASFGTLHEPKVPPACSYNQLISTFLLALMCQSSKQ